MDGHKRMRDDDGTVVTFYTPDRTFQRVYKGQSLEETKTLVRTKLGLAADASIRFSRLHEGRHIDLEDDDDFEAFRHLARYVTTLDVSVFLGNSGPPIFSQGKPAEAGPSRPLQRKRSKLRVEPRLSSAFSEATSGRSTPTSATIPRPPTSTLDAHGVPQKKRKRKEETHISTQQAAPAQLQPALVAESSRPEPVAPQEAEAGPSKPSRKKSRSKAKSSQAAAELEGSAPHSAESPTPVLGSKRKRVASPEAPEATVTRQKIHLPPVVPSLSRPPSPSSPIRKKRKKEKRSKQVDEVAVTTDESVAPVTKPEKKGKSKRKADTAAEPELPPSLLPDLSDAHGGETADTEDNVVTDKGEQKAKKEKKGKKEKKKVVSESEETPSEESSKKKRKRREAEGAEDVVAAPAQAAVTESTEAPAESSDVAGSRKKDKKKGKSKAVEQATEVPATEEAPAPDASVIVEATSAAPVKRKRASKSKATELADDSHEHPEVTLAIEASVTGPSSASEEAVESQPKEKKRKRRKTLAADTSVDPDASTISSAAAPDVDTTQVEAPASAEPESSSTAKKRGRKKSIAPRPSQAEGSDTASTIAAIAAAVQAVLAKNQAAASPPAPAPATEEPAPEPVPEPVQAEPVLPNRKRKAGKSKLRQAWGPEDISTDDQLSVSISAAPPGASSSSLPPPVPAPSALPEPTKDSSKATKRKKTRPSSAPSCPICEKASLHPRAECPVVKGGPDSIRKRIAQLKEGTHDEELLDELEVLLKEAQRRRKSAGSVLAPIQVASVPAATSEESTPSPVFPLSSASFAARPAPLPRVPAGSEISEVAVESKDEGSSNESSSSDDEDETDAEAPKASTVSFAAPSALGADLSSVDLEALLRGPVKPRGSILNQIPSSSSSEDEGDSDAEVVDLSEEEKNDRAYRRMSRKLERAASSSDEEHEPDAEAGDAHADADGDEDVAPPTTMDVQPNTTADMEPEAEADVDVSMNDGAEGAAGQDEHEQQAGDVDAPESKATTDQGYESDAEEIAGLESPAREVEQVKDQESSESEPESEPEEPTHRGDGSRVERTADVDGSLPSSQEPAEQLDESVTKVAELETAPAVDDQASEGGDDQPEAAELAEADVEKVEHDDSASDDDEEVERDTALTASAARALSPELGEPVAQPNAEPEAEPEQEPKRTPSHPPLRQPEPVAQDADIDMPADESGAHESSIELHPDGAPSDPIESLGSFADVSERRRALDDDPIEDADAEGEPALSQDAAGAELAALQEGTPPPAVHRTPGTVSRMKDRYGRLGHGSPSTMLPSLSEQLLGSLALSQLEADVEVHAGGNDENTLPEQHDESENQEEAADEVDAEEKAEAPDATSQQTQEEEADEPQELETRPRRTTRTTRRTSAMTRSSSIPEPPASTPTPAPPPVAAPKRRGRLTEEEKAAREAERKAERERKAAEKKAEREAKAAEKKAEKDAKEAVKRAEKEAKEAAKRAAKEDDAPKRGKGRATRGKATTAKPVSTRSRAGASAETEEPAEDEHAQEQEQDASGESSTAAAASTPGFSKVSWTTLPATQPRTQTESVGDIESSMVDELQPSSPSHSPEPLSRTTNTTEKDEADVSREVTITQDRAPEQEEYFDMPTETPKPNGRGKEPLFIPSSSQFPNTPFPDSGLPESTPYSNGHARGDESGSEADGVAEQGSEGAEEEDVLKPAKAKARPRAWLATAPYRRLSDIASQQLFTPSQIPSPALFPASQSQARKSSAAYGRREDEDDDDDDDDSDDGSTSGSDSDAGKKKSHIPRERRAGAGVQKKKKSLLSFA